MLFSIFGLSASAHESVCGFQTQVVPQTSLSFVLLLVMPTSVTGALIFIALARIHFVVLGHDCGRSITLRSSSRLAISLSY